MRRQLRAWAPWLLLVAQATMAVRSWLHYRTWPQLTAQEDPDVGSLLGPSDAPAVLPVAVIVPARDEHHNLLRLLPSLLCLEPPPAEILVVDDRSMDGTPEVAHGFGIRVVTATEPPPGWSGKNHACASGAERTHAPWLLFADADTWQGPASLGVALAVAEAEGADLLSVFPRQECVALWERLLLPFAFAHYLAAINPVAANEDNSPSAVANGQYFLIRRDAYERIGGHGAVRASLGEDVALAGLVRRAGGRVRLYRADDLVRVRMYRSPWGLLTGFRKFMPGYLLANPRDGAIIVASTALAGLPLIRLSGWWTGRNSLGLALASYMVGVLGLLPWVRWFGAGWWTALLQPVAYGLFQMVALDAGVRWLLGVRVIWKGRRYRA